MKRIFILSANPRTIAVCAGMLKHRNMRDVQLVRCGGLDSVDELLQAAPCIEDVVAIANGERRKHLSRMLPDLPVVDLTTSPLDVMKALTTARARGSHVAIVGDSAMLEDSQQYSRLLDICLSPYELTRFANAVEAVRQARKDGAQVLVAGYSLISSLGQEAELPVVPLSVGASSLRAAIGHARKIVEFMDQLKQKQSLIQTFLRHTVHGIVAIDTTARIRLFSPAAQHMLHIPECRALGRPVDEVCPQLSLGAVLASGREERNELIALAHGTLLCDKIPLMTGEVPSGALAILQDTSEIHRSEAAARSKAASRGLVAEGHFDHILGRGTALTAAVEKAKIYAITDSTILLYGESGTGKELFAQSIHNHSRRCKGPFVALNCAAMPASLLESELFGYEAGAFTGADARGKPGLFELAHQGTLFLDEIGEMELSLQGKLLRALQERKIIRLGGQTFIPVDLRLIAATNRNLHEYVRQGSFRADLYYRLGVLKLLLPPLRDCREDIPVLARNILARLTGRVGASMSLAPGALRLLQAYDWPGNVRELMNMMERLVALYGQQGSIDERIIREVFTEEERIRCFDAPTPAISPADDDGELRRALALTGGNRTQAARLLGISRVTLWRRYRQLRGDD